MDGAWEELIVLMDQLGKRLDDLTEIAREKTAAVMRDDLMAVNDCMKREQAISLALRSTDIKREKLLGRLGLGNIALKALPDRCPEEIRLRMQNAADRTRDRYRIYRSAAEVARNTLEINLHEIEKAIGADNGGAQGNSGVADIRA